MTEALPIDRPKGLSFRTVGGMFVATVVLGILAAVLLHRSFVAAERVAARHIPSDAAAVLRIDLEKVVLFAPARKVLMPLVNEAELPRGKQLPSRAERLAEHSKLVLGRDTRELVVAWGPGPDDWIAVAGGNYPALVLPAFEQVFSQEGGPWQRHGELLRSPSGLALAQAQDGALVLASSEARAARALPPSSAHERLGIPNRGALSFVGEPGRVAWLAPLVQRLGPLERVEARAEWSVPLEVEMTLTYASEPPGDVQQRCDALLEELLGQAEATRWKRAVGAPVFTRSGRVVRVKTRWDHESLERLAERIEARLEDLDTRAGAKTQRNAPH